MLVAIEITVENVVMSGFFNEPIDLKAAQLKLEGSKREGKRFPGLVYHMGDPKAAFLLFSSGKFVCTGTRSEEKNIAATKTFSQLLKTKGIISADCSYTSRICNLTAVIRFINVYINMEQFMKHFHPVIFEPGIFPGATYILPNSNDTFNVFPGGKITSTGIPNIETVRTKAKEFYNQLIEKNALESITSLDPPKPIPIQPNNNNKNPTN